MKKNKINNLLKVMKKLRDPKKGCDWDKKQTLNTIIPYSIEEVYEVAEQVYTKNYIKLKEELKQEENADETDNDSDSDSSGDTK